MSPVWNTSRILSPTRIDDRLEIELGGDALLDRLDDRQLGVALLGLLEQPLRLVEQAGVLQRDAHARGNCAQQAHVGFAEGVFVLVVLDDDHAEYAVAAHDGNEDTWRGRSVPGTALIPSPRPLQRDC